MWYNGCASESRAKLMQNYADFQKTTVCSCISWQKLVFLCPLVHFFQAVSDKILLELYVWHASCLT